MIHLVDKPEGISAANECMSFRSNRKHSRDHMSVHASLRIMYLVPVKTITVRGSVI